MAGILAGELVWKITGDSSGFQKETKKAEDKAGIFGKSMAKLGGIVAGAFAVEQIIIFGKQLVKSASDAAETSQKFGVVFRGIESEANAMARQVADAYNISVVASKELLSNTGNVLQSFGFTTQESLKLSASINGLAADLTSFTNYAGGAAEAGRILTKALLGERDALDSLGIKVTEQELINLAKAQGKVWQNLSATERATITYNTILDKSSNALGDVSRSSDTYAFSVRRVQKAQEDFSAQAGANLMPLMKTLNELWAGILESWTRPTAIKNAGPIESMTMQIEDLNKKIESNRREIKYLTENNSAPGLVKSLTQNIDFYQKQIDEMIKKIALLREEEAKKPKPKEQKKVDPAVKAQRDAERKEREAARQERLKGQKQTDIELLQLEAEYQKGLAENEQLGLDTRLAAQKEQFSLERAALKEKLKADADERLSAGTATAEELARIQQIELDKLALAQADQAEKTISSFKKEETAVKSFADSLDDLQRQVSIIGDTFTNVLNSIDALFTTLTDNRIAELDEQMNAEIEAAGVSEDTAIEKAQKELEIAQASGDADLIKEKENAVKRAQIEDDYRKKKAQAEYDGAIASWGIQVALATAQAVQAPLNAFVSALAVPVIGPEIAPVLAAAAGVTAGIQLAAVVAAKPQAPKFENGGIVPGNSFSGDNVSARVNSGEMVLNQQQQAALFSMANGGGGGRDIIVNNYIAGEKVGSVLYKMSQNGELLISDRAVVSK